MNERIIEVERKKSMWERETIRLTEEEYQEYVSEDGSFNSKKFLDDYWSGNFEVDYDDIDDTYEDMLPEENGGHSTLEVFVYPSNTNRVQVYKNGK